MKKVRIGIAGLGRMGRLHAETLAYNIPQTQLVGVCSQNMEEIDLAVKDFHIDPQNCFYNFEEMIDTLELDGVIIATTSQHHCFQIKKAVLAGLHVFCEKPLGISEKECREIENLVQVYPANILMIGFMRRFDPPYEYAYKLIREGFIGDPVFFRSYSMDPLESLSEFMTYLPKSGGLFLDMVIHDIDLARWMLASEPISIYSMGGCFVEKEFGKYDDGDNMAAMMQFQNQSMAIFLGGRTAPEGYRVETEIIGTRATIRIGCGASKSMVDVIDKDGVKTDCFNDFKERFKEAFYREIKEFVSCIAENRKPDMDVHDAVEASRIAELATRSYRENILINL